MKDALPFTSYGSFRSSGTHFTNAAKNVLRIAVAALGWFGCAIAAVETTPRLKPAAPEPVYLSTDDHARLEVIIDALKRNDFSIAEMTTGAIEDPIAKSLGQWLYHFRNDAAISVAEADAFLDLHPDWPMVSRIQRRLEDELDDDTPRDVVLALFETRDPLSGRGKLHHARALFAAGRDDDAVRQLRAAWTGDTFKLQDENALRARYGKYLTAEHHIARVDNLLWRREVTNARRVIPLLPPAERRKAEARALLLLRSNDAIGRYEALTMEDRADAGVMHAAVRYFRRTDEEPRALLIARSAPSDPAALRDPESWWLERKMLLRWAIEEKRFEDAYAMAASHGLEPGVEFSEAEFFAGWLALRFLNDPERADVHFKALTATVTAPISLARGLYWMGRAAEARGDVDEARRRYAGAAAHVYTFYGQLAAEKIGGPAVERKFDRSPQPTASDSTRFALRPTVAALRMLSDLDDEQAFLIFAYHVDDELETPGEYLELANLANARGAPHITVRAGKMSVRRNAFAPEVSYPLITVPDEAARFAPVEVILGLSRQESEFNPRAYSRAGARGVMQLIPSTAQLTARKEGLRYSRSALLDDPIYNMTIGSAHLSHLFEKFDGSFVMTFAAYNAGAHRVSQWVEAYGDPRSPGVDPLDWAEMIPFSETRNYVQRVLENTQIYRGLFNDAPIPGRLSADLERGGASGRAGRLPARPAAGPLAPLPERTLQFASTFQPPAERSGAEGPVAISTQADGAGKAAAGFGAAPQSGLGGSVASGGDPAPARQSAPAGQSRETAPVVVDAGSAPSPVAAEKHGAATKKGDNARTLTAESARASRQNDPAPSTAKTETQPTFSASPIGGARALSAAELNRLQLQDVPRATAAATPPSENTTSLTADREAAVANDPDTLLSAEALNALQAGSIDAEDASAPDPREIEECETYRSYIARTERDEAQASDLNAGMLAELNGDGPGCEDDSPSP